MADQRRWRTIGTQLAYKGVVGRDNEVMVVFEVTDGPRDIIGKNAYVALDDIYANLPNIRMEEMRLINRG